MSEAKNLFESLSNKDSAAKTRFVERLSLLNKQSQSDGYKRLAESIDMSSKIEGMTVFDRDNWVENRFSKIFCFKL